MRYVLLNLAAAFGLCMSMASGAFASETFSFEGVDITPVVRYYARQVLTLTKPVIVFNWGHRGDNPYWKKEIVQGEPSLIKMAKNETHSFWDNFGEISHTIAMYGSGLYAAADPAITFNYGGGSDADWLLFEMQLPKGFKFLDLAKAYVSPDTGINGLPISIRELMEQFDCPTLGQPDTYFNTGGISLPEHCRKLVKEIFMNDLKIDGFAYKYSIMATKDCVLDNDDQFTRAFVITSGDWITPKNVKFYTKQSRLDLDHRNEIQTWVLRAEEELPYIGVGPDQKARIEALVSNDPSKIFSGTSTKCDGPSCAITIFLCNKDGTGCENKDFETVQRVVKPLITKEEVSQGAIAQRPLWDDLEGMAKSPDNSLWIKQNKYGCSGELPYSLPRQF